MSACTVSPLQMLQRCHAGVQGPADNTVPLLQLPHFDQDLLKRLNRKRVRTLQDLFCMPAHERREVYGFGGEQGMHCMCCACCMASATVLVYFVHSLLGLVAAVGGGAVTPATRVCNTQPGALSPIQLSYAWTCKWVVHGLRWLCKQPIRTASWRWSSRTKAMSVAAACTASCTSEVVFSVYFSVRHGICYTASTQSGCLFAT